MYKFLYMAVSSIHFELKTAVFVHGTLKRTFYIVCCRRVQKLPYTAQNVLLRVPCTKTAIFKTKCMPENSMYKNCLFVHVHPTFERTFCAV